MPSLGDRRSELLNYIAIITYGRTGSTVLQFAMNQTAQVLVRGENENILRSFHHSFKLLAGAKANHGWRRLSASHPWFGSDLWDAESFLARQREMFVSEILKPHQETKFLGFKEIRHTESDFATFGELVDYLTYLDRLLPGIRFLMNRRDPASTARSGWWPSEPDAERKLVDVFDRMVKLVPAINERLGRAAAFGVDYDSWSSDPESLREAWISWGWNGTRQGSGVASGSN